MNSPFSQEMSAKKRILEFGFLKIEVFRLVAKTTGKFLKPGIKLGSSILLNNSLCCHKSAMVMI